MSPGKARDAATRTAIVGVCRKLYERGLIAGTEGNISVRAAPDRILITPAGVPKSDLEPSDVVAVDTQGRTERHRGRPAPSTEIAMHLRIYEARPDVHAVVHAHPPTATGFAVAGETFDPPALPEVVVALGPVALVPYATPGTPILAEKIEALLETHDVFLLANHGATTVGPSLAVAYSRMESLEHSARILLAARLVGRVRPLTAEQIRDLVAARDEAGRPDPERGVMPPGDGLETE